MLAGLTSDRLQHKISRSDIRNTTPRTLLPCDSLKSGVYIYIRARPCSRSIVRFYSPRPWFFAFAALMMSVGLALLTVDNLNVSNAEGIVCLVVLVLIDFFLDWCLPALLRRSQAQCITTLHLAR